MYIFGFLVFILVVVGLFCQYYSQVIGWKDSSPKWPILAYVSSARASTAGGMHPPTFWQGAGAMPLIPPCCDELVSIIDHNVTFN